MIVKVDGLGWLMPLDDTETEGMPVVHATTDGGSVELVVTGDAVWMATMAFALSALGPFETEIASDRIVAAREIGKDSGE